MRVGIIKVADFLNPIKENADFANRDIYEDGKIPPLAWHSYAAATDGFVHIYDPHGDNSKMYDCDLAIVTIDKYIEPLEIVISLLQKRGMPVAVGFHEGHQTVQRMPILSNSFGYFEILRRIISKTGIKAWVDPMPHQMTTLLKLYSNVANDGFRVFSMPSAWPMHLSSQFRTSIDQRSGIIVGTSDLSNFTMRNTVISFVVASGVARETEEQLTLITNGQKHLKNAIIKRYGKWFKPDQLNILPQRMPYLKWLHFLSKHKVAINLDMSMSQGQVVGDCAFVNVPSVGGNTSLQTLIYPDLGSDTTVFKTIYETSKRLLQQPAYYKAVCDSANIKAHHELSFEQARSRLLKVHDYVKGAS